VRKVAPGGNAAFCQLAGNGRQDCSAVVGRDVFAVEDVHQHADLAGRLLRSKNNLAQLGNLFLVDRRIWKKKKMFCYAGKLNFLHLTRICLHEWSTEDKIIIFNDLTYFIRFPFDKPIWICKTVLTGYNSTEQQMFCHLPWNKIAFSCLWRVLSWEVDLLKKDIPSWQQ